MTSGRFKFLQSLLQGAGMDAHRVFWRPPADIYRTHQGWLIKLELAGVSPGDLEVTVAGRRLQVAGRRRDWCIREGQRSYQMEIAYNRFEREFELPFDLKVAELETEYVDGMLLITLKAETGEP